MKRALLVHHTIQPPGGASCVAAWALQALASAYELTLLAWTPPDVDPVNRAFGTSLTASDFAFETGPAWQRRLAALSPAPLALLTTHLLLRRARALVATGGFDLVVSTMNEIAVGRRAVQYVHYPWAHEPRPEVDRRWYQLPGLVHAYRCAAPRLSGHRATEVAANLTLANSAWVANLYHDRYGAEARVVAPPAPGAFPDVSWAERENRLVCIGRFAAEKELPKVLRIHAGLRALGHDIRLLLVGQDDHSGTVRSIEAAARASQGAVEVRRDVSREELVACLAHSRFGIHGMRDEHFGIAAAELQRAGCIPFVPDSGGVAEIVDRDPRLTYASEADAIAKIDRALSDAALCEALRKDVAARRDRFSVERFCSEFLAAVRELEASDGRA